MSAPSPSPTGYDVPLELVNRGYGYGQLLNDPKGQSSSRVDASLQ